MSNYGTDREESARREIEAWLVLSGIASGLLVIVGIMWIVFG